MTLLGDDDVQRRLVEGLAQRRLREKFWYASDAASEAWLALCRSKAYRGYDRAGRTVDAAAPEIAGSFAARGVAAVEVVGLGAGDAHKELAIAGALAGARVAPSLVLVDVSRRLLEVGIAEAEARGMPARAIRADLDDAAHLRAIEESRKGVRLWAMLGNTIGALDRSETLGRLGRLARPGDALLVDGEVFDAGSTFGGYDNPDNRRFAWGPLADLGLTEADGTLDLWLEDSGGGVHAVRKRFTFRKTDVIHGVAFGPGDSLEMSRSEKYDAGVLPRLVERESGLRVVRAFEGERWTLVVAGPGE